MLRGQSCHVAELLLGVLANSAGEAHAVSDLVERHGSTCAEHDVLQVSLMSKT